MQQPIWSLIRETRSARPGRAQDDPERAAVYGAALQQFEELMGAAATAGYASRPLPLFYAVSQAGRAIAAAWANDPWILVGHGLKHQMAESPLRSTVRPEPRKADSFGRVAVAASQGNLTATVELGALWASLPDLYGQTLRAKRWRRPLAVVRQCENDRALTLAGATVRATICGLPDRIFEDDHLPADRDAAIYRELHHYPSAMGWRAYRQQGARLESQGENGWEVDVVWEAENPSPGARDSEFEGHAFQHRVGGRWWLRPDVNDAGDYLWPLMTWWALLFGLSMLARYHPAGWTAALRVDESAETVPLEAALD